MAIPVRKVADIVGKKVALVGRRPGDIAGVLTSLPPPDDPIPESAWELHLTVGEASGARHLVVQLHPLLSRSHRLDSVIFLGESQTGQSLFYFQNRLFMPGRAALSDAEREEIILRIKKITYDEVVELFGLRAAVANMEATIQYQRSGPRRDPIPEDVKLLVWTRDGGACVRCGAKADLHFDHVIPFSKGGGNTQENIQILCQLCNLKKSDKIAF